MSFKKVAKWSAIRRKPMTERLHSGESNCEPASAMRSPPKPKNSQLEERFLIARIKLAPCRSPLGSPALRKNRMNWRPCLEKSDCLRRSARRNECVFEADDQPFGGGAFGDRPGSLVGSSTFRYPSAASTSSTSLQVGNGRRLSRLYWSIAFMKAISSSV